MWGYSSVVWCYSDVYSSGKIVYCGVTIVQVWCYNSIVWCYSSAVVLQ